MFRNFFRGGHGLVLSALVVFTGLFVAILSQHESAMTVRMDIGVLASSDVIHFDPEPIQGVYGCNDAPPNRIWNTKEYCSFLGHEYVEEAVIPRRMVFRSGLAGKNTFVLRQVGEPDQTKALNFGEEWELPRLQPHEGGVIAYLFQEGCSATAELELESITAPPPPLPAPLAVIDR